MLNKEFAFIGREKELLLLKEWKKSPHQSQLTAIYGRRRIGKTRLVEEAYKDFRFLKFEGLEGENTHAQKANFLSTLVRFTGKSELMHFIKAPWRDILIALADALNNTPTVLFFDEFQWIAAERQELVSHLKYVWDNHFKKTNCIHLIICGSISSFIVKKVLRSKALYGRFHLEFELQPLSLPAVRNGFLKERSQKEVLEYYMMVGGVPEYLTKYDKKHSTSINAQDLFFNPNGYFFNEFERLFVSHFGTTGVYKTIIKQLALRPNATREELAKASKTKLGGVFSGYLEDLELSGFVEGYSPLGKKGNRLKRYRLSDFFLRFYFQFLEPIKDKIKKQQISQRDLSSWSENKKFDAWKGLAFEYLCYFHSSFIAKALGFSGISYQAGSWFNRDNEKAVQIDLIFKRGDGVLTVCEIKNHRTLTTRVIDDFERKIVALSDSFKFKSIEKVLISTEKVPQEIVNAEYFHQILIANEIFNIN